MLIERIRQWWAKRLLHRARECFGGEVWAEAAELAEEALRTDENNASARMMLGMARLKTEDYAGAVQSFAQLLKNDPDNAEAKGCLAMAYARAKRWDQAAQAVSQLAENRPATAGGVCISGAQEPHDPTNIPQARARTTAEIIRQGDWAALEAKARAALAKSSSDPSALLQLGMALYKAGRLEQALQAYDKALACVKKEADKAVINFNRSTVLMQLTRWEEACKAFETLAGLPAATRGRIHEEAILYNLAYCYRRRKMIKMARVSYVRLSMLNPLYKDVAVCLERLRVPLAANVAALPDPDDGICESCREPLPLGAAFCEHCGWSAAPEEQPLIGLNNGGTGFQPVK